MSHNQISLAVNSLQSQWSEELRGKTPSFIRWLVKSDESALINGFFKVESSSGSQCEDLFLSLFTPFEVEEGVYSSNLVSDFLDSWKRDKDIIDNKIIWESDYFADNLEDLKKSNDLFVAMLADLKEKFCSEGQRLTFILLPSQIDEMIDINRWLLEICPKLAEGVAICVVDYIGANNFDFCVENLEEGLAMTLKCGRFDINNLVSGLISSQQDTQRPDIIFQNCVLKMGDATKANNKSLVCKWGDEALEATRMSGIISFAATAYLVYAGFLMLFKDEDALKKLEEGEKLAEVAIETNDATGNTVLMQIYGYKSAYYSIMDKKESATKWSLKQADYAASSSMNVYAITLYRHSAQLALRCSNEMYGRALEQGYKASENVPDDELENSEIRVIASHYMDVLYDNGDKLSADNIMTRMSTLFGESWRASVASLKDKYAQIDFTNPIKAEKSV